jgi:putative DNA primase/helicase
MGSLAFTAASRAAWAVSKDKNHPDRRLLLPIKNNIGPDAGGLAYRIKPLEIGGCPVVDWEPDPVNINADDALAIEGRPEEGRTERDDAADWLREILRNGPRLVKELEQESREAGFAFITVRRAKSKIGVKSDKSGFEGAWHWALPSDTAKAQKEIVQVDHLPREITLE